MDLTGIQIDKKADNTVKLDDVKGDSGLLKGLVKKMDIEGTVLQGADVERSEKKITVKGTACIEKVDNEQDQHTDRVEAQHGSAG